MDKTIGRAERIFDGTYMVPHKIREIRAEEGQKIYGYAGKILRIDLTGKTTQIIPTWKYVPKYIGGWAVCNAIFWDEVKHHVGAFDPENETIFMTGPGAGSAIPISGRAEICGVSACNIPEQYTHSNMSSFFSSELKWAGYDGFIVTGKAPEHTYVLIEDEKVQFLDADQAGVWGQMVWESQKLLKQLHGEDAQCLVIGPAGENLMRHASITNSNDSVSAKAGFGAVWGSKNLKAVVVHGTGHTEVAIGLEELLKKRLEWGNPPMSPNPLAKNNDFYCFGADRFECDDDEWATKCARFAGCRGCNAQCSKVCFECHDPLNPGKRVTEVVKCVEAWAANYRYDCDHSMSFYMHSKRQEKPGNYVFAGLNVVDEKDPNLQLLKQWNQGDRYDHWDPSMEMGQTVNVLCTQYGIDKWEMIIWYMTWLARCKKEGLLENIDFGMEVDMNNPKFMEYFMHMVVYREGPDITLPDGSTRRIGDLFADGIGRAIRALGKEVYGDSIYHGRTNMRGQHLDIPVSNESSWGQSSHWQGRGFQGCPKPWWLIHNLNQMMDTRDNQGNQHFHLWVEDFYKMADDPAHSQTLCDFALKNNQIGVMKDTIGGCEWHTPDVGRPNQEAELMHAATGLTISQQDIFDVCEASRLMYRAILMRNDGRIRDMEVEEVYPWMTYPDPFGETTNWEEWNDLVDMYYDTNGYDRATGWPFRSTWEAYGLKHIADEMESLGKLPPEGGTPGYVRKSNPFKR